MWTLRGLIMHVNSCSAQVGDKWVPSRPINWKYRSLSEKIREAWAVFTGRADCFIWPEGQ
jgi:hypothetical protein